MSFIYNEEFRTIYATNLSSFMYGLNDLFQLDLDITKTYFGTLYNTQITLNGGETFYFYNREDLLEWLMKQIKTTESYTENYIMRYECHLKLAEDCIIPEKIIKELEVEIEDEALIVLEEFQDGSTEIKMGLFEIDENTQETIIEEDLVLEGEVSVELTKEQLPWKTMTGPKWSKQDILDEAAKYDIELDINLKKPELIESFKTAYNK